MTRTTQTATSRTRRVTAIGVAGLVALSVTCSQLAFAPSAPAAGRESLTVLFRLQAGSWSGGVRGSYFRMLQPDGKTYLTNTSSKAGNQSFTLLSAGTDGGLRTGGYQTTPTPAFAANGDARAGKVTAPTDFFGVKFATATNRTDPQTTQRTAVPVVYATGTKLSGNLSAFAASWNNQHFNQGSPKPNGSAPGFTRAVSGTYNTKTRAFAITWRSLIVGGPFNKFTGEWHLAGTFVPATKPAPRSAPAPAPKTPRSSAARTAPRTSAAPKRTTVRPAGTTPSSAVTRAATTAASRGAAAASPSRPATATSRAATAAVPAAASTAAGAGADTAPASQPAARNVADSRPAEGGVPAWLLGGVALVVVLAGLVGFRVIRTRAGS